MTFKYIPSLAPRQNAAASVITAAELAAVGLARFSKNSFAARVSTLILSAQIFRGLSILLFV